MKHEHIAELVRATLQRSSGLPARITAAAAPAPHRFSADIALGEERSAHVEGAVLYGDLLQPGLESRLRLFEVEAGKGLKGAYVLWVPPGAEIPTEGAPLSALVTGVRELAKEMTPGEVNDVALPVVLQVRKTAEEGQYATITGGLASWWSQISRFVRGVYQIDSRVIHRLPRDENFIADLASRLAEVSADMQVGEWAELPSADHWTIQRLDPAADGPVAVSNGLSVIAAPPSFDPGDGTFLRRTLRRLVRELGERLAATGADLRVALLVTAHNDIREENIGPALVGFDPAMYIPIDLLMLAADGEARPVLEPPAGSVGWWGGGGA